ncbi:protein-L-isoaspartate(D-aspartate) O-methyltransferase [Prosthecobacter sp.]|uniref:protein-L-isoaspartate(D-aspartate) O-methyltransferase n=1 Tax=Prosthecobacter sp. TaxID=1965333 RepID=UPI0031F2ED6A
MSGCCEAQTLTKAGDSQTQRERMVREQLMTAGRDIQNKRVLDAMRSVLRHEFVPEHLRSRAYEDGPLPIGHEQTISQPYIVAFMTEAIDPQPGERILEIGTGSGYQAAVLAAMGAQVFSIEIVKPLGEQAQETLKRLGYDKVKVRIGDGYAGWPEEAPFDAVIVTCAPESIPQPLIDQLKTGGRMIIPVGETGGKQELYLLKKQADGLRKTAVLPVRFVPMTGKAQKKGN